MEKQQMRWLSPSVLVSEVEAGGSSNPSDMPGTKLAIGTDLAMAVVLSRPSVLGFQDAIQD